MLPPPAMQGATGRQGPMDLSTVPAAFRPRADGQVRSIALGGAAAVPMLEAIQAQAVARSGVPAVVGALPAEEAAPGLQYSRPRAQHGSCRAPPIPRTPSHGVGECCFVCVSLAFYDDFVGSQWATTATEA